MAHRSAKVSSAAVIAGSGGAASPGVVPGSWPGRIVAAAPAAHSASRLPIPKQPNAPAVASASSAGTGSRVRRAKSSRSRYGCPATTAAAGSVPRFRTLGQAEPDRGLPRHRPPRDGPGRSPAGGPAGRGAARSPAGRVMLRLLQGGQAALALTSTPRTSTPCLRTSLIRLAGE